MNEATGPSEQKADLRLGKPPGKLMNRSRAEMGRGLLFVVLLQLTTLAVVVGIVLIALSGSGDVLGTPGAEDVERIRDLALQLENRSLDSAAADSWERYLAAAPDADDQAQVYYRIGKLRMQAEQFGQAAAALVQAEQLADDDDKLKSDIGLLVYILAKPHIT